MLVNRSNLKSSTEKTVSQASQTDHAAHKRAAVIGLAVAATVSVVSVTWSRLHAEDNTLEYSAVRPLTLQAEGTVSDSDLLKQADNQFRKAQYEDARSTLSQINASSLSESDQKKLASVNGDVESALAGRQEARAKFAEGQLALDAGNNAAASKLFKEAGASKFADDATRQKSREQLTLVGGLQSQRASEQKADYQQAKKDFEAGDYAGAKSRFQKLEQAGYKAPMFQTSPGDFLKQIDQKTAVAAEGAVAPVVVVVPDTAKAEEAQAKTDAQAAKVKAKADTQAAKDKAKAEADKAEADAEIAEAQAKAEAQAAKDQAKIEAEKAKADAKIAEAQAKADAQSAKDKAKAEAAVAKATAKAESQATEDAARAGQAKAKDAYVVGVAALKAGDFAVARENFKTAEQTGYKPSLFEASPTKMLAEVDARELKAKPIVEAPAVPAPAVVEKVAPAVVVVAPAETKSTEEQAEADRKIAVAQAKVERDAADAAAKAERQTAKELEAAQKEATAAQAKADREAATASQVAARADYKAGNAALKAGDFEAARKSFKAADEAGFKPGVFEATAAKMLVEVDATQAASVARAEKLAATDTQLTDRERVKLEKESAQAKIRSDREAAAAQAISDSAKKDAAVTVAAPSAAAEGELEATAKMEQIRQQARAYDSQQLVDQARAAQAEGRSATALDLYSRAAATDPSNQAALDGRNLMLTLQGRAPVTSSLLDEQSRVNRARKESIAFAFNDAIDRARANMAADDYPAANLQVQAAVVARQQDPNLFTQDEIRALDTTLAETQLQLRQGQEAFTRNKLQRESQDMTAREQARLHQEELERRATVSALISDSRRYIARNQYREALATIDQIITIDPTNQYATGVRPLVEDRALLQQQRDYREEFRTEYVRTMNSTEEAKIPYGDVFRYPDNWADITQSRDRFVEEERGMKQADKAVRAALDKRLPDVRIDGQAFDDVIQFLREMTGANIFVKWSALEQASIDRKTPVSVQLRDVKFSKVLQTVLESVSNDTTTRLAYTVSDGVITIYVTQDPNAAGMGAVDLTTRVYDITDLMFVIPDLDPGTTGGNSGNNSGGNSGSSGGKSRSGGSSGGSRSGGSGGGGGGGGLFGGGGGGGGGGSNRSSGSGSSRSNSGSSSNSNSSGSGNNSTTVDRMDDVTLLIAETVAVDTWDANGGPGSIRPSPLNQQLIITQTPEVHAQIDAMLAQLREAQAIQVTVEARFLTVSRNFLQDVGMDFDFSWNNDSPVNFSPINVQQNSSAYTANPNTGVPGSLANSFGGQPAATLSGTYLDDFQVTFLIRATQATVSQSVVTAPRVTVYNGGSAVVWVYTYQPYVSSLTPVVASGVVGYDQTTDQAVDGVTLFVRANVSADRKYVTLYLAPELNRLLGIQNFSFQQASTLPAVVGGTGAVVAQQPTLTLQQPITQTVGVETLVSVPDGGTLLLGGQTVAGEIEREAGVPILSKIPIIKRFFTNKSMAKDEAVLLILVKPTIIIQKEQEARQFPLLSSKISGQ